MAPLPTNSKVFETYEDKGSNYAAERSDAYSLCEYKLRKALGIKATDSTKNLDWYNAEMDDCTTGYACFIMELLEEAKQTCSDPVVLIEKESINTMDAKDEVLSTIMASLAQQESQSLSQSVKLSL